MFVIVTYDVSSKRGYKILKICRRYLTHVQKSVFEGDITHGQLESLKKQVQKVVDLDKDQVAIYRCGSRIEKEVIGYHMADTNIL